MNPLMRLCVGLAFLYAWPLFSQDIHFSQYYHAPQHINPALTGVHTGDISFTGNYRSQWRAGIYEPYTTVFAAADKKFYLRKKDNQVIGGGLALYYDGAGAANLNVIQVGLSGSYTYFFNPQHAVSAGLQVSVGQRSISDFGKLSFDNQWIDGQHNPNAPTNELFENLDLRRYYPSFGAGLNYLAQHSSKRTRLSIGGAAYHLNRPDQSFWVEDKAPLPMRFTVHAMPSIQLAKQFDLILSGAAQFQGPYMEALGGGGLRIHISQKRAREMAIQLGAAYRFNEFGDAIIPGIEFHYAGFLAGFTYDINISDFQTATNRNGGPELAIRYLITHVKNLKDFRICRLF